MRDEPEKLMKVVGATCSLSLTVICSVAEAADKNFPEGDTCDTIVVRATAMVVIVVHVLISYATVYQ